MGGRSTAALLLRDDNLKAIGAENSNGGLVHIRVKHPLNAAKDQGHPSAFGSLGGHDAGERRRF